MAYRLLSAFPIQIEDANGNPAAGHTLEFFIYGTSTPAALYIDAGGTSLGTSCLLNSLGRPRTSGGVACQLFGDTTQSDGYKIIQKDADGAVVQTFTGPIFPIPSSLGELSGDDADIAVLQPLTGAVARTQHDKNSEFVSIKDFTGADPTGATDSTAAFVSAIASGKAVYIGDSDDTYLISGNVAVNNSVVLYGRGATINVSNAQNSNGFYAASAIDYFICDGINFTHTKTAGIYTQAITLHNCNNIRLTNSNIDSMTQFGVAFIYDADGTYNSLYIDNVHITNAGNTANGVNLAFEVIARNANATIENYYVGNSLFKTASGVGGGIAKFGVAKNMVIDNVRLISPSRTGASSSSGVEYGSDGTNTLAASMKVTMRNVVIEDGNNTGLYPLLARSGELILDNSNISNSTGDYGIYCGNSTATKVHIKGGSCGRISLEGSSLNFGELIIDEGAEVTQVNYEVASTSTVAKIRVTGGAKITRQLTTRNSNLVRLELDGAVFPIADLEHYLYGSSSCIMKDCIGYPGSSVAAATNAFVFYSNAAIHGNNVSLGSNRTYYFTYANSASIHVFNNKLAKSDENIIGAISGSYVMASNFVNGDYRDVNMKRLIYGTAAPVSGTYAVGDRVINTGVTAGGHIGWVCTTAGSPGTWKTYGAVTA